MLSLIIDFIEKTEIKNTKATGIKLLKKKVDAIKELIEDGLTDAEVFQIFQEPTNINGFDIKKLVNYMKVNIFDTLEDRIIDQRSL